MTTRKEFSEFEWKMIAEVRRGMTFQKLSQLLKFLVPHCQGNYREYHVKGTASHKRQNSNRICLLNDRENEKKYLLTETDSA